MLCTCIRGSKTLLLLSGVFYNCQLLLLRCFSRVWLCATPQTVAHQAPPSLGFSRQEHWSGLPFSSPIKLLDSVSQILYILTEFSVCHSNNYWNKDVEIFKLYICPSLLAFLQIFWMTISLDKLIPLSLWNEWLLFFVLLF